MKICPRCGSEFQDRLERCLDCSATLKPESEMPTLPASAADVCLESGEAAALRPLSARLRSAGIPTRLAEESDGWGVGLSLGGVTIQVQRTHRLYVADRDLAEAEEHARALFGEIDAEPRPVDYGEGRCPACGAELEADRDECPECLLMLDAAPAPPDFARPRFDAIGLPLMPRRGGKP